VFEMDYSVHKKWKPKYENCVQNLASLCKAIQQDKDRHLADIQS